MHQTISVIWDTAVIAQVQTSKHDSRNKRNWFKHQQNYYLCRTVNLHLYRWSNFFCQYKHVKKYSVRPAIAQKLSSIYKGLLGHSSYVRGNWRLCEATGIMKMNSAMLIHMKQSVSHSPSQPPTQASENPTAPKRSPKLCTMALVLNVVSPFNGLCESMTIGGAFSESTTALPEPCLISI